MKLPRRKFLHLAASAAALSVVPQTTRAQAYPNKPVQIIVPFIAGSDNDLVARIVGKKLSEVWRQQVTVENRLGDFGTVGANAVAKAPPDGHTLLANTNSLITAVSDLSKVPYHPLNDFVPLNLMARLPYVLVVGKPAGVGTVAELVAAAKANPGKLTYGGGRGTLGQLVAEKFKLAAKIDVRHVPSEAPKVNTDVIEGRITYWLSPLQLAMPHVRGGRMIALAVTSPKRVSLLPDVPSVAELGLGSSGYSVWSGMWAPAKTAPRVADAISAEIARAIAVAEIQEEIRKLGADPATMTQSEFARFVASEAEDALRTFRAAGVAPN
jgi:tripartite-type tricarboxylate transporter receptor subunit TctC